MRKLMVGAAGVTVAAVGAAAAWLAIAPEPGAPTSEWVVNASGSDIGGPFTLTTHEGETITADELIDGPTLIYFGYTWCPDVCPMDTQRMVDAVMQLEARGIEVDPVFITVDPARDDVESLSYYADAYHPRMTALTGSAEAIRAAAGEYKVYYSAGEAEGDENGYLVNHTAYTYLMTPDGLAAMFRNGTPPDAMADEVARALTAGS